MISYFFHGTEHLAIRTSVVSRMHMAQSSNKYLLQ